MSLKLNVLLPDGDSTWALSVLQCLSQTEGYKVFVLSNKKRTSTKYSKFTSYYKFYQRPSEAAWLDCINYEIEANSIDVVMPVAETEISFLIKNKHKVSQRAKVILLPELKNFETVINKNKLSDFAKSHGIPHPKSFHITTEVEKEAVLSVVNFPLLIKPLSEKGGDGIEKIISKEQFPKHIAQPLFIQEYIEGYDIDCSVLCQNGKVLTHTIQKGNLKGDSIFAPQLGLDFLDCDEVLKIAIDTMSKLNWSGVAHLDLRYDEIAKEYKLIEINARFWGSVEASRVAGINFPDISIQLALGEIIEHQAYNHISYMRLKGVLKEIKSHPSFIFKRKYLMNNTETKTVLSDPLPTMYKFREWLGRQF